MIYLACNDNLKKKKQLDTLKKEKQKVNSFSFEIHTSLECVCHDFLIYIWFLFLKKNILSKSKLH